MSKPLLSGMEGRFVNSPNNDATAGPPSKIFHLTDNDDDGSPYDKDIPCLPEVTSPEGSWSDCSVDDFWGTERNRDALRKFHALKELLATEVGYLKDLKALVTVTIFKLSNEDSRLTFSASERFIFVIFRP